MDKAAIYARYSSDNQRDLSIDAQVRLCKDYIKNKGYVLSKIYTDEALTGKTDQRPEFQQMFADAKRKSFDVVVTDKVDRFARDKADSAIYKRELRKKCGVRVEYASQHIDASPEGELTEGILENLAQYYSANLARETMKGLTENALRGWHTGGIPPLGLRVVEQESNGTKFKAYDIHKIEGPIIQKVFDLYDNGYSYYKIIAETSEAMIAYRGRPFSKNVLHDILRNEKYTGTFIYCKGSRQDHRTERTDTIKIPNAFTALISMEVFDRVQAKLDKMKQHCERGRNHRQGSISVVWYDTLR